MSLKPRMSLNRPTKITAIAAVALATLVGSFVAVTNASAAPTPNVRHIQKGGTAQYRTTPTGSGDLAALSTEIPQSFEEDADGLAAKS